MPCFAAPRSEHEFSTIRECYSLWVKVPNHSKPIRAYVDPVFEKTRVGAELAEILSLDEEGSCELQVQEIMRVTATTVVYDRCDPIVVAVERIIDSDKCSPAYLVIGSDDLHRYFDTEVVSEGEKRYFMLRVKDQAMYGCRKISEPL